MVLLESDSSIWTSECCYADPVGGLDMSTINSGGPMGVCGYCYDHCNFLVEDTGPPFDTREEKDGER